MLNRIVRYFLLNKLVTSILLLAFVGWGIVTSPFNWETGFLPSDPVTVDAIPNIGENQQIVFTEWAGQSPRDVEDQITYPLTSYLLGIPGVKSVRSSSMFGFSSIYLIFEEDIEFYWSRSRILEKLNSIPPNLLPENASPSLGPDATALGQVYWYTIEGRDEQGNPTGGWDLHELRTIQDYYVKYGLNSTSGVSEVASIGGHVKEYQIDVDPAALKAYDISLSEVVNAVRQSNRDVGAKTLEINKAEYLVRGLGYIEKVEDIEQSVLKVNNHKPIKIKDVARVKIGPAQRRGLLDKEGAEAVGGVVIARHGANPMKVIENVKAKIAEISPGLPSKKLDDGTLSKLEIVPFYDRSGLIQETLGTLEEALTLEILITIIVVIVMVFNLRASLLISSLLPIAVLMVFIAMRYFGITANIVALSGIAIAIGTMIDLGVILSENVLKKIDEERDNGQSRKPAFRQLADSVYNGAAEVSTAIVTAVMTTIVSFIPVFALQGVEGKLFTPLAFTKTFALVAALIVSLLILPALAHWFFGIKVRRKLWRSVLNSLLLITGVIPLFYNNWWAGLTLFGFGLTGLMRNADWVKNKVNNTIENTSGIWQKMWQIYRWKLQYSALLITVFSASWLLAINWLPLGAQNSNWANFFFVIILIGIILTGFKLLEYYYGQILNRILNRAKTFLVIPAVLMLFAVVIWLGFSTVFGFVAKGFDQADVNIRKTSAWSAMNHTFPGIGKEFMPALDEGSFLLMPTSMPHSGMEYNKEIVQLLDTRVYAIPEIKSAVGKMGRAETALDPAPISMFENIIRYKPEYILDEDGRKVRFAVNENSHFILSDSNNFFNYSNQEFTNKNGEALGQNRQDSLFTAIGKDFSTALIQDANGRYFRNWRPKIQSTDDIWDEIVRATKLPGVTSAPKLQPIETRLVMLQTGMRAPMGIKVFGPDLKTIENFGSELEKILKEAPGVKEEAVFAERIVGKPYLNLDLKREKMARYGLTVDDVQNTIQTAIGGMKVTSTVEGRERFDVRIRYPRELRNNPETIGNIYIESASGAQIPLSNVVDIQYERGPQAIKSENTFKVGYVLFDKTDETAEVEAVQNAQRLIDEKVESGELTIPSGISYEFSGDYENQVRAEKRLSVIIPIVLVVVFLILYFQFNSASTSFMVFTGIAMAFSGGFMLIWLYGQGWFMNFSILDMNFRDIFQIKTINLSVAVWVGFIALFGIATDDGVLMGTYLDQSFRKRSPESLGEVKKAVIEAGKKRIRPAVMTSATTLIALLPILSSTGKGSDIMVPMAIPAFGGMIVAAVSYFVVPVLYYLKKKKELVEN
ncbi:MAG: efflux RND transporter permease subunit [Salibacter sp.]|uniref:efflux RND transporter permease subunit n=1 Tax=Salibacter sp. TaxID=2010995 RepID=UPI00287073AE|nr:efflux RND transporter permease subunit [Salibacter sp.]MDR9399476.1 efflux RND transporter permease subunit [Salibacter sp.]